MKLRKEENTALHPWDGNLVGMKEIDEKLKGTAGAVGSSKKIRLGEVSGDGGALLSAVKGGGKKRFYFPRGGKKPHHLGKTHYDY